MSSTLETTPTGPGSVSGAPNLPGGFTDTFTSRYVDCGEVRLHAVVGGAGPPLLLIHGWPGSWYYWRLVMPALPAFALLTAAVPLLVPSFLERAGPRLAPVPGRRPGLPGTAAVVAFLAVVPIAVLLVSDPIRAVEQTTSPRGFVSKQLIVDDIGVPADGGVVSLHVRRVGTSNVLAWTDSTKRTRTFYNVYRGSLTNGFPDMVCELRGVDRCELRAETLTTTREQHYVDPAPPPDAVYRVGVAANWLDETDRGDVFAISPPAAP